MSLFVQVVAFTENFPSEVNLYDFVLNIIHRNMNTDELIDDVFTKQFPQFSDFPSFVNL